MNAEQNHRAVYHIISECSEYALEFVELNRYHVYTQEQAQLDLIQTRIKQQHLLADFSTCLLYTSPSPRDA